MDPRGGRGSGAMERRLKLSSRRFAAAMSSIMEKYNFSFDEDRIVSIKSLTYNTPDGPKVWGEETSTEIIDRSHQSTVQCQEETETSWQQFSASENGNYTYNQMTFEEESFMNSYGVSQLDTDHQENTEVVFVKRHLENIHLEENIPLESCSGTPVKSKCSVEMDMLLEEDVSSVPSELTVKRTQTKNVHQRSPLQELEDNSLTDQQDSVLTKQAQSTDWHPSSVSVLPSNSVVPSSSDETSVPRNQSLWSNNETGHNSFLEMYESADEHCSWNNVTIADLYPGMVKTLSKLLHKASGSLIKWYKYGYWHRRKTKFNTSTERIRKSRPLKLKSSLTVRESDGQRHTLPTVNNGSKSPFDNNTHHIHCSGNNVSTVVSSRCHNVDTMDIDCSGIVEDYSYRERVQQDDPETALYSSDLCKEETFLVKGPQCITSRSDCVMKGKTLEQYPTTYIVDSGTTFNLATESKTRETTTTTIKLASCLSSSLSNSTNSYLQNSKTVLAKISNGLPENHEIKMFKGAISRQRSHSFSSFSVNRSPIKVQQKCEDAFEKVYNELCSPKLKKPFKISNTCASPKKSADFHRSGFNSLSSSKFHQITNSTIECIYQKLCSEGFPKIPPFLRAANLKKYEGIQMSETVNALVNSPIRTLPAVARIKRAANFCNEDCRSSPIKRLKNISENSSHRISEKVPYWKNINVQKTDMTFTLYSTNKNKWTSHGDSGFCISSNHHFLATASTDMNESRIVETWESFHPCFQKCDSLRKSQKHTVGVSRKLSYNDGRAEYKNAYVKESMCKNYEQ
ncbi:Holliday junction recognition protein [Varanus komodoensis]|uniref:Holliday junction recognition protein n=1 Tax=Varanus komodoensis TaxID=61221 RepID=UPI001CF7E914|nr:Holliday junction recognition protein [Varanus komodoensis]